MAKYVTYFRVSTTKQGNSGLGLEAQRAAVSAYIGPNDVIVGSHTEIESGRNCDRPELHKAMDYCRLTGATLLIAKLDRLSRRVSFLAALMDSDVPFVAADNPHATRFTLHILAAVAEHEAEAISQRTKAALRAAKARGVRLGGTVTRQFSSADVEKSASVRRAASEDHARRVLPVIEAIGRDKSLRELANELNARGVATPRGGEWKAGTVWRVMQRAV